PRVALLELSIVRQGQHGTRNVSSAGVVAGLPAAVETGRRTFEEGARVKVIPPLPAGRVDAEIPLLVFENTRLGHLAEIDELPEHARFPALKAGEVGMVRLVPGPPGLLERGGAGLVKASESI